ncbi:hypothetical protein [Mycobacterium sp. SMC-4]|uniref:hypothetical protein n=1 Tax=Mycobacterium sp. SMC-4 TaxID=2857059 RepID=UPI003D022CEF
MSPQTTLTAAAAVGVLALTGGLSATVTTPEPPAPTGTATPLVQAVPVQRTVVPPVLAAHPTWTRSAQHRTTGAATHDSRAAVVTSPAGAAAPSAPVPRHVFISRVTADDAAALLRLAGPTGVFRTAHQPAPDGDTSARGREATTLVVAAAPGGRLSRDDRSGRMADRQRPRRRPG